MSGVNARVTAPAGRVTVPLFTGRPMHLSLYALQRLNRYGQAGGLHWGAGAEGRGHSGWTGGESSSGSGGLHFALFRNRSTTGYAILFILSTAALQRCSMLRHTRCVALR
jgi:hypothetical protein